MAIVNELNTAKKTTTGVPFDSLPYEKRKEIIEQMEREIADWESKRAARQQTVIGKNEDY